MTDGSAPVARRALAGVPVVLATVALVAATVAGCGDTAVHPGAAGVRPVPNAVLGSVVKRIRLPGAGEVLVTRQNHPRGGWQVRLYVKRGDGSHQLTGPGGLPLVPFVATDTNPQTPVSADCTEDGLAVTVAEPTTPSASPVTWSVRRTTYRISDVAAIATGTERLGGAVPDRRLRAHHPELFAHRMFVGCPSALPQ